MDPDVTADPIKRSPSLRGARVVSSLGLLGSPWVIAQNFRHNEQVLTALVVFRIVFLMTLLVHGDRHVLKELLGRKLALIAAVAELIHVKDHTGVLTREKYDREGIEAN